VKFTWSAFPSSARTTIARAFETETLCMKVYLVGKKKAHIDRSEVLSRN